MQELQGTHKNCRLELGLPAKPDLATCLETASAPTVYIFCIQGMADPFQGWEDESVLSSLVVCNALIQCLLSPTVTPNHQEEEEVLNAFFSFVFAVSQSVRISELELVQWDKRDMTEISRSQQIADSAKNPK